MMTETCAVAVGAGGAYRAGHKPAAAVGTDVFQDTVDAIRAERTFIAANAGIDTVGWQVAIA